MTMSDWNFKCPECGSAWFGSANTTDKGSSKWLRHCHDQFNTGCKWRGYEDECSAKEVVRDAKYWKKKLLIAKEYLDLLSDHMGGCECRCMDHRGLHTLALKKIGPIPKQDKILSVLEGVSTEIQEMINDYGAHLQEGGEPDPQFGKWTEVMNLIEDLRK